MNALFQSLQNYPIFKSTLVNLLLKLDPDSTNKNVLENALNGHFPFFCSGGDYYSLSDLLESFLENQDTVECLQNFERDFLNPEKNQDEAKFDYQLYVLDNLFKGYDVLGFLGILQNETEWKINQLKDECYPLQECKFELNSETLSIYDIAQQADLDLFLQSKNLILDEAFEFTLQQSLDLIYEFLGLYSPISFLKVNFYHS